MGSPNKRLVALRKAKHLSQIELAQLVGVSLQLIRCWEKGLVELKKASYENVMKLANVLEVDPEELVPEKEWRTKL